MNIIEKLKDKWIEDFGDLNHELNNVSGYFIVGFVSDLLKPDSQSKEIEAALANTMFMTGGNTDAEKSFYAMGAKFGYSISEKEIDRLKRLIETLWKYGELDGSYEDYKKENNL